MKFLGIIFTATFLVISQTAAAEDVYDFRGIRLGIPLTEFRQLRYPDAPKTGSAPQVVCAHDIAAKFVKGMLIPSAQSIAAGITTCVYSQLTAVASSSIRGVALGEFGGFGTTFTFVKETQDAIQRLVSIELRLGNIPFDTIVSFLAKTYGAPLPPKKSAETVELGLVRRQKVESGLTLIAPSPSKRPLELVTSPFYLNTSL